MSAKFRKQGNELKRNFVAKFRAGWTKFRVIRTKFRFHQTKFRSGGAKFRMPERNFVWISRICSWPQNTVVIITSYKSTITVNQIVQSIRLSLRISLLVIRTNGLWYVDENNWKRGENFIFESQKNIPGFLIKNTLLTYI